MYNKGLICMLNIVICDDDIPATGKIDRLLQKIAPLYGVEMNIEVFWTGGKLEKAVELGAAFDIIYLDIEMDKEDGITVAKKIREFDKNVLIIYVTNHENYMKASFAVRPFEFLVKPVNEAEFESCFKRAYEEISNNDYYFRYRYMREECQIPIRKILYFESIKRKISIVTLGKIFNVYEKLNIVEESLKGCKVSFLRVHQSFLVNYKHIFRQSYNLVIMDDGREIPISEDRRKMIGELYGRMESTFYIGK